MLNKKSFILTDWHANDVNKPNQTQLLHYYDNSHLSMHADVGIEMKETVLLSSRHQTIDNNCNRLTLQAGHKILW